MEQDISLTSPQGYDVYYTVDDDAVLPPVAPLPL